jgi:hypothetical protein
VHIPTSLLEAQHGELLVERCVLALADEAAEAADEERD